MAAGNGALLRAATPPARLAPPPLHLLRSVLGWRAGGFLLVALLLLLWEASARLGWVGSENWPPVSRVFLAAAQGLAGGELGRLLASTLARMAAGFALGSMVGVALGLLLGTNRWARYAATPWVEILRPIPVSAIVPPLILLLGVNDALKIAAVALACFFPVFTSTLAGVRGVDAVLLDTGRTFRAGRARSMLRIVLPATLPAIAAGLRVSLGLALVVTIVAEMLAGSAGLGYYIVQMQYAMKPEAMYAAVILLAAAGYLINRLFLWAERRLLPWVGR